MCNFIKKKRGFTRFRTNEGLAVVFYFPSFSEPLNIKNSVSHNAPNK